MSTDDLERINDLSSKVMNHIATASELIEYKQLLQKWNDQFEKGMKNYHNDTLDE